MSALGLNGQLCECQDFDFDLKRYQVLTRKGDTKKVKPDNLEFVTRLSSRIVSAEDVASVAAVKREPSKILRLFSDYQLPIPLALPGKIFDDCIHLENDELRRKLVESKPVGIDRLEDFRTRLFFLSFPRSTCDPNYSDLTYFQQISDFYRVAAAKYPLEQIFFILPQSLAEDAALPQQRRAVACAYPLAIAACCAVVLFGTEPDLWQQTDIGISRKIGIPVYRDGVESNFRPTGTGLEEYSHLMDQT